MVDQTRRLSVRLAVDGAREASGELRRVGDTGNRSLAEITAGARAATAALRLIGPAIGALSLGGLTAFTRNALDTIGGLGELAEQAGISTDALQAFQFGATQAGISSEELQRGIQALTRRIADAAEGQGDAAAQMQRLGLAFLDASGNIRPTEAVLADVADAVAAVENPAQRAAIATAVFGDRLGQRLVPFLAQGRAGLQDIIERAIAFGAVVDAELIAKADEAADRVAALTSALGSLARTAVAQVAPAVIAAAQAIERLIQGPSLRSQREALAGEVERVAAELREAEQRAATARTRADEELFGDRVRQLRQQLTTTQALLGQVEAQTQAVSERAARVLAPERPGAPPLAAASAAAPTAAANAVRQQSELERTLARLRTESLRQENRAIEEAFNERARLIQASLTPVERYQQRIEALTRLTAQLQAAGSPLPERAVIAEQEAATAALNSEIERLSGNLGAANAQARQTENIGREIGLTFESSFERAISSGENFRTVLASIANDLSRLALRQFVTQPLFQAAGAGFNALFPGLANIGNPLLGLFGGGATAATNVGGVPFSAVQNATGNAFGSAGIIPFARGGVVRDRTLFRFAGGVGEMGEAGPEAILPLRRNRNGRLGVEMQGGGGGAVTININSPDADGFRRTRSQIAGLAADVLRRGQRLR